MFLQMIQSRVFVFLAVTLCFVTCLCADADDTEKERKAEQAVTELQKLTAKVLDEAEKKSRRAGSTKTTVEEQKEKAVRAESDAKAAPKAITAENRKAEAETVAENAKKELDACLKLHTDAKNEAEQAFNRMNEFLSRARDLSNKGKKEVLLPQGQSTDYAKVIESASSLKNEVQALNREIDASPLLTIANIALSQLREGTKKVQVLKYQAESIVSFASIESMLKMAKIDIQSIEEKRDKINTTVQEMGKLFKSYSGPSIGFLKSFCGKAESELETALRKVKEAQNCNKVMLERHPQAVNDLAAVQRETEDDKAKTQAETVKWQETFFAGEIKKIKQALQTAVTSVSSAKSQHQQMIAAMTPNNSQSGTGPNKDKQKDGVSKEEITTSMKNGETLKSAITKTDEPAISETNKTVLGESEDTMDKSSEQPIDAHLDKTKEHNSAQLTDKEKQNPKDDNSESINSDKLRNITKDITNNSLIGGELPPRSAANDSAVTVFIPLLVALIVSAVLQ